MKKIPLLVPFLIFHLAAIAGESLHGEGQSLTEDLNNEVDSRIEATGNTPGEAIRLYSLYNKETSTYTRNPKVWTGNLDFTGVFAAYHCHSAANYSIAALITPQDLLSVAHVYYPSPNNDLLSFDFVDANNRLYNVAEASSIKLTIPGTDTRVIHLASPLPSSIKVYKLLPPNYADYSPEHNLSEFPVVGIYPSFNITSFRVFVWDAPASVPYQLPKGPVMDHFLNVYSPVSPISEKHKPYTLPSNRGAFEPGSSGSPIFVIINGEPVLVGCIDTAPGGTTFVAPLASQLNEAIATLAKARGEKPYRVKTVNLSGFPSY